MADEDKTYTAVILLDLIFEFIAMTPNRDLWNEHSLMSNPPRLIRFQQIEALLRAFNLTDPVRKPKSMWDFLSFEKEETSIEFFLRGSFIKNRPITTYAALIEYIKDFVTLRGEMFARQDIVHVQQLVMPFQKLVDFKKQVRSLLTFNSGWLEAGSTTAVFSIFITNSVAGNLVGKYDEIDAALEMFINPDKLSFTEAELISKYNFPDKNLREIEMDYI